MADCVNCLWCQATAPEMRPDIPELRADVWHTLSFVVQRKRDGTILVADLQLIPSDG